MSNDNLKPVIAVGGVLVENGKVLLIKRGHEPAKSKWAIPGGKIKFGEKRDDAVKREFREETGLDVEVGEMIYVFDAISENEEKPSYHYVIIDFIVYLVGGKLKAGDDALEAKWFTTEEMESDEIAPETRKLLLSNTDLLNIDSDGPKQRK